MFKDSKNPIVAEFTKIHRKRSINLYRLKAVIVELPDHTKERRCAWCAENKLDNLNQKYCCTNCRECANAWAYPQKEQAVYFLLLRQDWKCNICKHQYGKIKSTNAQYFVRKLKRNTPPDRKPEVDHIVPIYKGGESIGLANIQIICYFCHKVKTKIDNSKPRKKNENK